MMLKQLLPAVIITGLASCVNNNSTEAPSAAGSITDSVRFTLQQYHMAVGRGGLIAEIPYLDSSADFFWMPPGYASAISYDSVCHVLRSNTMRWKQISNSFDTLRIIPLADKLATYTGKLRSVMTDSSGKTDTFFLWETGVMIRRPSGWKLLHGQTAIVP